MDGFLPNLYMYIFLDKVKNLLDFDDLDPIFKVTRWLRLLETGFSAHYTMKELMEFDKTCTTILLCHDKELIRFL